jgi:hypothetical protein
MTDNSQCQRLHDWRLKTDGHIYLWRCQRCGAVYPYRVGTLPPEPARGGNGKRDRRR